jgi:hypothetical protein
MRARDLKKGSIVATHLDPRCRRDYEATLTLARVEKIFDDKTILIHTMIPTMMAGDYTNVTYELAYSHAGRIIDATEMGQRSLIYTSVPQQVNVTANSVYKIEDFVYTDGETVVLTYDGVSTLRREMDDLQQGANDYFQYDVPVCETYLANVLGNVTPTLKLGRKRKRSKRSALARGVTA